jgi:hypothetical protein
LPFFFFFFFNGWCWENQVSHCIIFIIETHIYNLIVNQTVWSSNLGRDMRFCLVWNCLNGLWGPPTLLFSGYKGCSPQVEHLRHKVDHSRPSGAEVKNTLSCSTTPPVCKLAWTGTAVPYQSSTSVNVRGLIISRLRYLYTLI